MISEKDLETLQLAAHRVYVEPALKAISENRSQTQNINDKIPS